MMLLTFLDANTILRHDNWLPNKDFKLSLVLLFRGSPEETSSPFFSTDFFSLFPALLLWLAQQTLGEEEGGSNEKAVKWVCSLWKVRKLKMIEEFGSLTGERVIGFHVDNDHGGFEAMDEVWRGGAQLSPIDWFVCVEMCNFQSSFSL